ncbi:hypothetical protein ACTA71_008236 [Dictyostelium dimigraforme]
MKFLFLVLVALLAVSFASANYQCGKYQCAPGYSCVCDGGVYRCVYHCSELTIVQTIVNSWADNNGTEPKVQVSVDIINNTHRTVKDVIIATDTSLLAFNQIWGVNKNGYLLDLPSYATIAAGAKYNFGYICQGKSALHLYVGNVYLI